MSKHYHIVNGDALKAQFPTTIEGELIVARECLVDGDVKSDSLEELYKVRATFISTFYPGCSFQEYYKGTVSEFEKIKQIPTESTIYLWFEDDLFCQVNFWFVGHLLFHFVRDVKVFLVRPTRHTSFGFGGLTAGDLVQLLQKAMELTQIRQIARLWGYYQNDDTKNLLHTAKELSTSLPFIVPAVEAHIARIPSRNNPGRPIQALLAIMEELKTDDFAPIFREFSKRESIYGFGDVQVQRLLDQMRKGG